MPLRNFLYSQVAQIIFQFLRLCVVPENPSDGQLIFLTAADAELSLEADKAYRWDAASGKWVAYTGAVAIV